MMRLRVLVQTVLAVTLLAIAATPTAEAQKGLGKGRNRPPPAPSEQTTSKEQQPSQENQPSKEELAPGEYSFEGIQVLEAINRGEGRRALAYYERAAVQAEQQGNQLRAARALGAATTAAVRLGRYQKAIQSGTRSIELFKTAAEPARPDLMAWVMVHAQLAAAYRVVGDLTRARQVLEEGLEVAKTRLSGRREGQVEGYLLNGLARVSYLQQDYQTALARSSQAAQYFEDAEAHLPPRAPEALRTRMRRWTAIALYGIGRAQLALKHPDEADAAFDKSLRYARLSGLSEVETEILGGQANLALSRQDWSKAAALYHQSIGLANRIQRVGGLPYVYHGLARAYAGLGRTDEALAASREAVRYVEDLRADLGDSELRSGYFEEKQAIYRQAVYLALQAQHPDEAFALAERSRSRTFLDLLGSQTTLSKGRTRALVDEEVRLRARLAEAQAQAQDAGGMEESDRARAQVDALDRDYRSGPSTPASRARVQWTLFARPSSRPCASFPIPMPGPPSVSSAFPADIARTVDAAGVDHVGIGTDMEGEVNEVWAAYGDLPAVANLLLKQGCSPEEASELMGRN